MQHYNPMYMYSSYVHVVHYMYIDWFSDILKAPGKCGENRDCLVWEPSQP